MNIQRINLPERETLPRLLIESFQQAYLRDDHAVAARLLATVQHLLLSPELVTPEGAEAVASMLEEVYRRQPPPMLPRDIAIAQNGGD